MGRLFHVLSLRLLKAVVPGIDGQCGASLEGFGEDFAVDASKADNRVAPPGGGISSGCQQRSSGSVGWPCHGTPGVGGGIVCVAGSRNILRTVGIIAAEEPELAVLGGEGRLYAFFRKRSPFLPLSGSEVIGVEGRPADYVELLVQTGSRAVVQRFGQGRQRCDRDAVCGESQHPDRAGNSFRGGSSGTDNSFRGRGGGSVGDGLGQGTGCVPLSCPGVEKMDVGVEAFGTALCGGCLRKVAASGDHHIAVEYAGEGGRYALFVAVRGAHFG